MCIYARNAQGAPKWRLKWSQNHEKIDPGGSSGGGSEKVLKKNAKLIPCGPQKYGFRTGGVEKIKRYSVSEIVPKMTPKIHPKATQNC